ncbi:efflux RND transporter permease subunit [Steroidobacter sp. S1-65]|uniref:Efflux RND transporter permease subunit n=1 Tax=Steroidobacter gossypii TaxID=2805490 RepID=A0ABS1X202_9GAMM|nr:efflux RND transporter permease subunit [Steroidobacter gossypii]MBM0107266.1 efflux RND transporter permease subunit [Steroidobacter gossypii]
MKLSELSVRRPVFATVISLLLIIFGLVSLQRLAVREYPDIDRPVVSVTTTYTGASAAVIETKITQVIEDSVAGIEGILKIESDSEDERSSVRIEFDVDREIDGAANDVRDRVARVLGNLPEEADPPEVLKADAGSDPVMYILFSSDNMSVLEVTDYAERNLIDRLSTVPGVARVSINGARRYSMRIWLDRQALAARQLTVTDVEDALRRENVELPAGRIESKTREFTLRTLVGLDDEQDFRDLVIARGSDGHLIRLSEVAKVQLAAENDRATARFDGEAGVSMAVEAQSKANTLDIVRGVRAEIDRLQDTLPRGAKLQVGVDNGIAIEAALREVIIAVVFALLSVLLVIYAFLGSLRATLIPAVTIPVSIIASFTVMYALGYSVNVLTLLGLVLAIGLVVDDAIVVLENVHRRTEMGEPPLVAAVTGSSEIGFAVIATTLTLAAVFIPISFLPGDLGRLFSEFGFTLAASVLFSALVALTLTPMLASKLPELHRNRFAQGVDRFFRRLSEVYDRRLRSLIRRPWLIVGAVGGLVVLGAVTFRSVPSEFTPLADSGRASVSIEAPEGTSFDHMYQYALKLEAIALKEQQTHGDIEHILLRVPGAGGGQVRTGDVNSARVFMMLTDWHDRKRSAREIQDAIVSQAQQAMPGVRAMANQFGSLGRRGSGRPFEAVLGGPDYESLAVWSNKMLDLARQYPGLRNVDNSYKERKPQLRVSIDRSRAAELGVSLQVVGRTLETVLGSRIVTTYVDRGREYNVILQASDDARETITDLTNIRVRSARGDTLIPLSNVVQVEETAGAVQLPRFNRLRSVEIRGDLAPGYTLGDAIEWFQETAARELPPEAVVMWDGESEQYLRAGEQMYLTFFFALAVVFLVLAAQFESFVHPAIIMVTVPLALLGAVFGLKLYGQSINIFSQIAVVMLIGIAAKNGVLIVEFANQLRDRGVEFTEAVVKAAETRLRPVLMTSLCTAFGALPLLFATGAGSEQRIPIGIVVFYGTIVSVFLTLFAVPAVYSIFARRTKSPEHVSRMLDRMLGQHRPSAGTGSVHPLHNEPHERH